MLGSLLVNCFDLRFQTDQGNGQNFFPQVENLDAERTLDCSTLNHLPR